MPDVAADRTSLRREAGWVEVPRRVVRASGRDAVSYLQGQLTQDVAAVAVGASSHAFVLEPQGRIVAWLRVTRTGDQEMVLDVDVGFVEPMLERLERFKIRTDCTFEELDWRVIAVRGPMAHPTEVAGGGLVVDAGWPGIGGFDLLGPAPDPPVGVRPATAAAFETVRVEAGVPSMRVEIGEKTLPHELGRWVVDASVSFTKGCYTGQELVYRIDSRGGNVPRHLRGVVVEDDAIPTVGAEVSVDGKAVGTLTSVAESVERGGPVALAFIHRSVEPPSDGTVDGVSCRIESLPLVGS